MLQTAYRQSVDSLQMNEDGDYWWNNFTRKFLVGITSGDHQWRLLMADYHTQKHILIQATALVPKLISTDPRCLIGLLNMPGELVRHSQANLNRLAMLDESVRFQNELNGEFQPAAACTASCRGGLSAAHAF